MNERLEREAGAGVLHAAGQARAPWGWLALVALLLAATAGLGRAESGVERTVTAEQARIPAQEARTLLSAAAGVPILAPSWLPEGFRCTRVWSDIEDRWGPLITLKYQAAGGFHFVLESAGGGLGGPGFVEAATAHSPLFGKIPVGLVDDPGRPPAAWSSDWITVDRPTGEPIFWRFATSAAEGAGMRRDTAVRVVEGLRVLE